MTEKNPQKLIVWKKSYPNSGDAVENTIDLAAAAGFTFNKPIVEHSN